MSKAFIGTSGWTYDGWRGRFYLETLRKSDWLARYAGQFPTTEINRSFYRTPSLDAVGTWRDQTPKDFVFAWKASKFKKRRTSRCTEADGHAQNRSQLTSSAEARRKAVIQLSCADAML
jgi:uncharacterized protein YecE (DUF72 family)